MIVSEQIKQLCQVSKLAHNMITSVNRMYQALYHPYSNPERSQQKCADNAAEFDSMKDTFENIEMDNILKSELELQ